MFLALTRHEHVVFVLALFFRAVFECRAAVAEFLVVEPLAGVFESVRAFRDLSAGVLFTSACCAKSYPEAGAFVVLPLAHICLHH